MEINAAQFRQLDIQLGSVEEKNLSATLKTTGFLKVPPQNKASITSIMGGTVQKIFVQEGDYVKKGKTLITLTNPEFVKMQQDYLDAAAQLTFAEADYNRQKTLAEGNVTAQKTFQQATASYQSQQAKLNALRQQLSLLGIDAAKLTPANISSAVAIKSPVSGYVAHIDINLGATVEPSLTLLNVIDNSQLHLDALSLSRIYLK
ncbi:MAG: efflux RND transporter periplasmic adaptor subunit [Chitinophagaceae bacterium]|nr:efflux RND transporter periplasmic adaptor subunit [Chitinophagaceae bacterium]